MLKHFNVLHVGEHEEAVVSSLARGPASPAVRKPAFELAFGSGSADDWARALAEVSVEAGLAPAVDAASVVLAARDDAPSASRSATPVTVSLGFADDATVGVFAGTVRAVNRTVAGKTRVVASNGGAVLAAFRLDQGYEQQSAGAVVRDLAGKAAVDTGAIDDGPSLPYYVVDSRRSAWDARREARGAVRASRRGSTPTTRSTSGRSRREARRRRSPSARTSSSSTRSRRRRPRARSPSSARARPGSKGSDAWSWNLKDASPLKGTAGTRRPGAPRPARRAPQRRRGERRGRGDRRARRSSAA